MSSTCLPEPSEGMTVFLSLVQTNSLIIPLKRVKTIFPRPTRLFVSTTFHETEKRLVAYTSVGFVDSLIIIIFFSFLLLTVQLYSCETNYFFSQLYARKSKNYRCIDDDTLLSFLWI